MSNEITEKTKLPLSVVVTLCTLVSGGALWGSRLEIISTSNTERLNRFDKMREERNELLTAIRIDIAEIKQELRKQRRDD